MRHMKKGRKMVIVGIVGMLAIAGTSVLLAEVFVSENRTIVDIETMCIVGGFFAFLFVALFGATQASDHDNHDHTPGHKRHQQRLATTKSSRVERREPPSDIFG